MTDPARTRALEANLERVDDEIERSRAEKAVSNSLPPEKLAVVNVAIQSALDVLRECGIAAEVNILMSGRWGTVTSCAATGKIVGSSPLPKR